MKPEFAVRKNGTLPLGTDRARKLCWEMPDKANFCDVRKLAPFQAVMGGSDERGTTVNLRFDSQRFDESDIDATVVILGASGFHMSLIERFVAGEHGGRVMQLDADFDDRWAAVYAIVESPGVVLVPRHPEQIWENGAALAGDEQHLRAMWNQLPLFRTWMPGIAPKRNKSTRATTRLSRLSTY